MADVLVVDDEEDVAFLMAVFLENDGHQVRLAPHGEAGLARLRERLPELVVLDVEMPLLSGPGMAAHMLMENAGRERIPIIIVSGVTDLRSIAERVGTPYHLAKPFDPAVLLALVRRAVQEGRFPTPPAPPSEHTKTKARSSPRSRSRSSA